jgi:flavodoxin
MSENLPTYSNEGIKSRVKTIVIYDTLFGNTKKVAEALSKGIEKHNVEVKCLNIGDVDIDQLAQYNLVAVGAPILLSNQIKSTSVKTIKPMVALLVTNESDTFNEGQEQQIRQDN